MEESWETGERDDKARRREESCYSENNGIGEVREIGKKLIFYASDRVLQILLWYIENYCLFFVQAYIGGTSTSKRKTEKYAVVEKGERCCTKAKNAAHGKWSPVYYSKYRLQSCMLEA